MRRRCDVGGVVGYVGVIRDQIAAANWRTIPGTIPIPIPPVAADTGLLVILRATRMVAVVIVISILARSLIARLRGDGTTSWQLGIVA